MPWKVVEVDVQEEEATVNLGSLDQNAALYRVEELAKFSSDEDVDALSINISTAVSAGSFSISIFNEIHIFDAKQLNFMATLSLESNVDTMAWSSDSQFLVIGDSSGTIHFFSFACGDVVFSTNLVDIAKESVRSTPVFCNCIFTRNEESGSDNLMIMSTDGSLFSFKNLPLRDLSSALESKDLAYISKFKENSQMEIVEVAGMDGDASYCNTATIFGKSSFIVAASGTASVSIWSDQNVMDTIDQELLGGAAVRKCQVTPDSKYLVVLDEHSNLSIWDTHTLVMLQAVPSSGIKDFILTTSAATNETDVVGADAGQVVLLTDNRDHQAQLEIYQLPQFQKTYSREVSQSCCLTDSSCYQEKVFYIDVNTNLVNNNSVPSTNLVYKCLSEASPQHRVNNLVRKKKFDGALEFSRAFGLDVEFVYKAKASCILADISTKKSESDIDMEEKAVSVDALIDELQDCLENVKSAEFCVDCCLKASPPTLEQVYKLLCFAKEKVKKVCGKEKHRCSHMMIEVLHSIQRLETFKMIFDVACFTAHKWQQFSCGDMLTYVMQFLSQGKMSNAAIIWRRHQSEFENSLTAEILKNILASVRSDLPSSCITPWLKSYLIPLVLYSSDNEEVVHVLASWIEQRVASLELSEKDDWPNNGLEMAMLVFDLLSERTGENSNYKDIPTTLFVNQVSGSALVQACKKASTPNPVSSLSHLVEHLSELKKLHANYHCKIPLAEFAKETPLGIMFKMLDSVLAIELIPSVIRNQITRYGIQHGIQIDDVLLKYIDHQVKQVSVSNLSNTLCEARLVEITKCIKTRTMYFEAILQLMAWASVPWSSVVEEMVSNAMADDPSNESLKWSYRLMELKKTVSQYGLRGIEFSNDSHVKGVVKYILNTLNEGALEDALQIAETYHCFAKEEVYFTRLQNLCLKGLLSECIKLLKIVPRPQIVPIVKRFLIWISIITEDHAVDMDDFEERAVVIEAAIHILEHLCNTSIVEIRLINHDMDSVLQDVKNVIALQKEFSIIITLSSYQDVDAKEEILLAYIREHDMSKSTFSEKRGEGNTDHDKVSRLASLFGFPHAQVQSKILLQNLTDGSEMFPSSAVAASCKMECELSSEELFNLCLAFFQKSVAQGADVITTTETNISKMLYSLACSALTHAKASSLDDYLELSKLCWLSTSFYSHCESGDLSLSTSVCEEDPLLSWSNTNQFQDNGFVLDSNIALPLHHNVLSSLMLVHLDPAEHLGEMATACQNLIGYLQENNLHEVALHYGLHSLSHLLKYCSSTIYQESKHTSQQKINSGTGVMEKNPKVKILNEMSLHGTKHIANMLLNLMTKVLNSSNIDQNLALGYLCSVPEDEALQKLKSDFAFGQGHNSSQVMAVLRIAHYYAANFCDHNTMKAVEELYSTALWYSRLQKLGISCAKLPAWMKEKEQAEKVLELLLEKSGVDVNLIIEFCKSFDIDVDEALCSYIKTNLVGDGGSLSNAPNRELNAPETTTGMKNLEDNYLYAISCISNSGEKLLPMLKDVLQSFSPYNYEKIALVLNELIKFSNESDQAIFRRQLEVLKILSSYKRTVSPSKYELQYHAKQSVSSVTEFPVFSSQQSSQERLPFHPLIYGNPWKVIAPELTDETTPKLLPLCRLLKMSEDQVYITAVENLVSSCLLDKQNSPSDSAFSQTGLRSLEFKKAEKLLSAVNNTEFVVKTAVSLLTKWPQNEEKVEFANKTVERAFEWKSSCKGDELDNAKKTFTIAQDITQEITIQHILSSNGVTEEYLPKFKKFQRSKLICQLYEVYGCAPETSRPNVHKITEEIAKLYDVNIRKLRLHLVDTWLPSSCPGSVRSSEHCSFENQAKDQNNLKRVLYLLEAFPVQQSVNFLLSYAYRSGPSKITYQSRVRAMEVLFNVASCEIITAVANDSLDGIKEYMKSLIYLAELEHLHLPQTVESLQRCNKEGLVKGLWKNYRDNINAILLIADICLDSKISDPQVWTNILKQLLLLGLTKYLSYILPLLTKFPNLWQMPNLIKVWEEVTLQPLQKAVTPLSVDDRLLCERSMLLLQKCPLMVEVDISKFFEKLVQLSMPSYALACLPLLPNDKKPNIGTLISPESVNNVLNVITDERAVGKCLTCPDVIEGLVFEFMVTSSSYKAIQSSDHFVKLADYLIAEKKLCSVIMEMIKHGELEFAVQLAKHYHVYGSPMKRSHFKNDDSSTAWLNALLCFLENAGVLADALPYLPANAMNVTDVAEEKPKLEFANLDESSELGSPKDVDIYDVF